MSLRLIFRDSNIDGGGNDPIGSFTISGIYSEDGEHVVFTKTYRTHSTDYMGTWDGMLIYGRWTVHDENYTETGDFEIWPERELELLGIGASEVSMVDTPGQELNLGAEGSG